MIHRTLIGAALLTALAGSAAPAAAQEVTAEVRTWDGRAWRLTQPSFEVFYTLLPKPEEGALPVPATPPGMAPPAGLSTGPLMGTEVRGSVRNLQRLFGQVGPEPLQGHRRSETLTVYQAGIARQVPASSLATLAFRREPVVGSPLPPYVAPSHFRYSVSAVLADGSRVEGDYVNWGTAVLRGMTSEGRVEIPWQEIELVRFNR
jgi:hypothetical protein